MFTLIPFANDKVLGFRIEGKITGEMLEQMLAVVEAKLQEHPRARIYVEMPAFEGMSVEALYKDLKLRHQPLEPFRARGCCNGSALARSDGWSG